MELHVRVVEAQDIPKMDFFGKADPYCILQMSSSSDSRKTKVCSNTYTPVWNEEFHFPVANQTRDALHILIKDRDRGMADDPISKIEIPISSLQVGNVMDRWYNMNPIKGVKKGGRLRLVLHLAQKGLPAFQLSHNTMMGNPMMPPPQMGSPMMPPPMQNGYMPYNQYQQNWGPPPPMNQQYQPPMNQQYQPPPMSQQYQQYPPPPMMGQPYSQYSQPPPMSQQYQQYPQPPMMGQQYQQYPPPPMMGQQYQQYPPQYQYPR